MPFSGFYGKVYAYSIGDRYFAVLPAEITQETESKTLDIWRIGSYNPYRNVGGGSSAL